MLALGEQCFLAVSYCLSVIEALIFSLQKGFAALGNLSNLSDFWSLNSLLENSSYVSGFEPSQNDVAVFKAIKIPIPTSCHHAQRWYDHLKSFSSSEMDKFTGVPTSLDQLTHSIKKVK